MPKCAAWIISPEKLRRGHEASTRWCWWCGDKGWQTIARGVADTRDEARRAVCDRVGGE